MPMIRIELFGGRNAEQKVACARDIVAAVTRHLGAPAEATQVMFVDVDKSDWLMGAKLAPPNDGR
jgi:4-oxalocrotonate tautomerase